MYQNNEYEICEYCGQEVQMIVYERYDNKYLPKEHTVCPNCDKLNTIG